jgi:NADPH-dependent 2,4-dienoyl-CoA reductase/sulfur reductase-like enzyme
VLRRHGYAGPLRMVCAEPHPPYDRPPLSKELLHTSAGDVCPSFRAHDWYERQSIELLLGVSAGALDLRSRRLVLSDGSTLSYRQLLIATGSRARTLPILARYDNVTSLRTIEDCHRLRGALRSDSRLAVIGAGFIGQEVAAAARRSGCQVTMIEAAQTPLFSILGERIGEWFASLHRGEGVCLRTNCTVERVVGRTAARRLCLSDGSSVSVDHIVVGVGVEPDAGWLRASGLPTAAGGISAEADGRTSAPGVWAAGDVAAGFDRCAGRPLPGGHWETAARQGARAARAMLGLEPGTSPIPSFWTDQYGMRIQYLGHAPLADGVEVDGDLAGHSFIATYTREARAVAMLLVNRTRSLPAARAAIEKGMTAR